MEEKSNNNNFLVGIRCFTFNQSQYVIDALNGFTMQQTTFPYIAMVVDDASTDGEQEVIAQYVEENFDTNNSKVAYKKETDYAHITYAQHKTNKNCYIVVLYLKENHYRKKPKLPYLSQWRDNTKYEALCEGDDYWIDPLKLQKQVDFMEKHPEHSLCFHAHTIECDGFKEYYFYDKDVENCNVKDLILADADAMATNSMLYKTNLYSHWKTWAHGLSFSDFPLELTLAELGLIGYINDNMSTYRLRSISSWSSNTHRNVDQQIKNRKERLKMWEMYDMWTNGKHKTSIFKMYMYDIIRLCVLYYIKIFNLKESDSRVYQILRSIYKKIK